MEKWVRNLSQPTVLIFGIVSAVAVLAVSTFIYSTVSGLIPLILMGAVLGGDVGFATHLFLANAAGKKRS